MKYLVLILLCASFASSASERCSIEDIKSKEVSNFEKFKSHYSKSNDLLKAGLLFPGLSSYQTPYFELILPERYRLESVQGQVHLAQTPMHSYLGCEMLAVVNDMVPASMITFGGIHDCDICNDRELSRFIISRENGQRASLIRVKIKRAPEFYYIFNSSHYIVVFDFNEELASFIYWYLNNSDQ
ncbi:MULTISPECIES: hypothetical protein [unclassified Oleiphilus]|uniref:hypothetical protein n=1 Tax=unclassified Oleiphilus TaxID=2631174 RepID=UPI0007C235CF|nr:MULTISPECIES: hypothetical protein [unclassified Oleiphilus]KZY44292.1 hypothetical protein A3732_12640 [Oleiphilus sp. HI0050]KZZ38008.1 hypothetical protein A3757_09100 [Oleiphilus sp. HI0117]KZZ56179.1 hypothetical protein A3761_09685 [Oleiphilus sp. HI0123]